MLCQQEEREAGRAYPRTCPTCKLGPCQKFGAKPLQSLSEAQAEIARLTAERDQALARSAEITSSATALAAAAAMEMRERAANSVEGWSLYTVEGDPFEALAAEEIRDLPIDPDAQKALDKMLAKAREDAIREAAHLIECDGDALGGKSGAAKAILALLNDGGGE